jgi:tetratricopeptide (TPR) repeat protein
VAELNYQAVPEESQKKAKVFFDRGAQVARAGQWDYAIEMYMQGLALDPEALEAHQQLRDISLKRKASGGKKMGMFEAMKFGTSGKDAKQNFLNAERQLAFEPGDTALMTTMMESAYKAGAFDTTLWIAKHLVQALDDAGQKSGDFGKYVKARDVYRNLKRFSDSVEVSARLLRMKPDDSELKDMHRTLSAEEAMFKGNYQKAASFRDSMRDKEGQQKLIESDKDIGNVDYLEKMVIDSEAQLAADPNEQGKMAKVIDALRKIGTAESEERAMIRAGEFYEKTHAFRFKMTAYDIRLRQLEGEDRALRAELAKAPTDAEKRQAYIDWVARRAEEELAIFTDVSTQYPTETKWKYQMAERLVRMRRFVDAIPIYQEVVNDPKLRNEAKLKLGQAFLEAEFFDEAADTLKELMESYEVQGDPIAKETYYWHGRANEAKNSFADALKSYSQVMKWEFTYRDVQKRIKDLRAKTQG